MSTSSSDVSRIVYFGDSVLERISRNDSDRRTLVELISTKVSKYAEIVRLSHGAAHPGLFYALLQFLIELHQRPSIVVIPINMRCFSPQWNHNPQWQFEEYLDAIQKCKASANKTVPLVPEIETTVRRDPIFETRLVDCPGTTCRTVHDFREIILSKPSDPVGIRVRWRELFIFHYLPRLPRNHRRLVSLLDIHQLCEQERISTIFYVTPINYQAGLRLVDGPFADRFAENIQIVMSSLHSTSCSIVVDWSRELDDHHFFHADDPTEHLNEIGRARLAELVAGAIVSILKNTSKTGPSQKGNSKKF